MSIDVKLFEDLESVERDAEGSLDRGAQPSLFARLSWFKLVAEHGPPQGKMLILRAQSGADSWGRTKVWLFLTINNDKATILSNWYSLRADAVHFQRHAPDTQACLIAIARELRRKGIASLLVPRLCGEPAELEAAFAAAGWKTHPDPHVVSWQIETRGMNFDAYWATRPSRLRNTAGRKTKAAGLKIQIYRHFEEDAWRDYETIYGASWKPEEGSPAFLRALAMQEGGAGTLRLGLAYKAGQAVAAQLWIVEDKVATIHKLAYREDSKAMSPGTVLSMAMFRSALDQDQVERIDYGTGDDGYKRDWMDSRHLLWRFEAHNPSTLGGLKAEVRARVSALVHRLRSR